MKKNAIKSSILITIIFLFSCTSQYSEPSYRSDGNGGNLAPSPILTINNFQDRVYIKGGSIYNVKFTVTDAIGFNSSRLEYSRDGGINWQLMTSASGKNPLMVPSLSGEEVIFDWAVPKEASCAAEQLLSDSNQYKIRIFASGRPDAKVTLAETPSEFTVDSCSPNLDAVQFSAGTQNRGFVQLSINGVRDAFLLSPIRAVCIKNNSNTQPSTSDSCWRSLRSLRIDSHPMPSLITLNYFAGFTTNLLNLNLWVMDQAENISVLSTTSGTESKDFLAVNRDCIPATECSMPPIALPITLNTNSIGSGFVTKTDATDPISVQTLVDPKSFVITANGDFIYRDAQTQSIKKLNLINESTASTLIEHGVGLDGDNSVATVFNPARLGLDFEGNLYILDNNKIRKVTFAFDSSFQVTTIVGGGVDTLSQSMMDPLVLQITSFDKSNPVGANQYWYGSFEVLRNGKIYFSSNNPIQILDSNSQQRSQLKVYDPSEVYKIKSIDFTGTGVLGNALQSIENLFPYSNFGLILSTNATDVQKMTTRLCESIGTCSAPQSITFDSLGVSVGSAGHLSWPSYWSNAQYFNSVKGDLFTINTYEGKLSKLNSLTNSWDIKLGTGIYPANFCADGVSALSCSVRLWDSYVGHSDVIYFIDHGRLRFVDIDGKVKTLTQ